MRRRVLLLLQPIVAADVMHSVLLLLQPIVAANLLDLPGCETVAFCASVAGPVCGADSAVVRLAGDAAWAPPRRLADLAVPAYASFTFDLELRTTDQDCARGYGATPRVEAHGGNGGGVAAGRLVAVAGGWRATVPTRGPGRYVTSASVDFDRCEAAGRCDAGATKVAGARLFAVAVRVVAAAERNGSAPGWAMSENRLA